jgi:hypothetical protein
LIPFSVGIEDAAQDSTLAPVSGASVTVTDMHIGMKRVTTTNQAGYLHIDETATSDCAIRIKANGLRAWELTGLLFQVDETRAITPQLGMEAVSAEVRANAAEASVDLVSAKTESIIPEINVRVIPHSDLDGS